MQALKTLTSLDSIGSPGKQSASGNVFRIADHTLRCKARMAFYRTNSLQGLYGALHFCETNPKLGSFFQTASRGREHLVSLNCETYNGTVCAVDQYADRPLRAPAVDGEGLALGIDHRNLFAALPEKIAELRNKHEREDSEEQRAGATKLALILLVVAAAGPAGAKQLAWHSGTVAKVAFEPWCEDIKHLDTQLWPPRLPLGKEGDAVCGPVASVAGPGTLGPAPSGQALSPETQFLQIDGSDVSYVLKYQAFDVPATIDVLPGSKVEYAIDGKYLLLRMTTEGPWHRRLRERGHGFEYDQVVFKKYKTDIIRVKAATS